MIQGAATPVITIDVRKRGIVYLLPWSAIVFLFSVVFWNPATSPFIIGADATITVVAVAYAYLVPKRVEFYDGYAKVFSRRGRDPRDVPYSDLDLSWTLDRRGNEKCVLRIKGGDPHGPNWIIYNARIPKPHSTLFNFLKEKTGTT